MVSCFFFAAAKPPPTQCPAASRPGRAPAGPGARTGRARRRTSGIARAVLSAACRLHRCGGEDEAQVPVPSRLPPRSRGVYLRHGDRADLLGDLHVIVEGELLPFEILAADLRDRGARLPVGDEGIPRRVPAETVLDRNGSNIRVVAESNEADRGDRRRDLPVEEVCPVGTGLQGGSDEHPARKRKARPEGRYAYKDKLTNGAVPVYREWTRAPPFG